MFDDYSRKVLKNLADSSATTEGIFEGAQDIGTSTLGTIDISHKFIHNGRHFFIQNFAMGVAKDASYELIFTTPDTLRWAHFNYKVDAEDDLEFIITEGVTSSGGTSIIPVNNNRNSATPSTLVVVHTPISVTGGTVIVSQRMGLGAGINVIGGVVRGDGEIVLKQNTKYSIDMVNKGAVARKINWTFYWYENLAS